MIGDNEDLNEYERYRLRTENSDAKAFAENQ